MHRSRALPLMAVLPCSTLFHSLSPPAASPSTFASPSLPLTPSLSIAELRQHIVANLQASPIYLQRHSPKPSNARKDSIQTMQAQVRNGQVPHDVKNMAGSLWASGLERYKQEHQLSDAELWEKPLRQNQHLQSIKLNRVVPMLLEQCAQSFGNMPMDERRSICEAAAVYKIVSKRTAVLTAQKQATTKRTNSSYTVRQPRLCQCAHSLRCMYRRSALRFCGNGYGAQR